MKRVMVTVTDMTKPSEPGTQHSYAVSGESDDIVVELTKWVESKVKVVLGGVSETDDPSLWEDEGAEQQHLRLGDVA
jgi:hypothetical protein